MRRTSLGRLFPTIVISLLILLFAGLSPGQTLLAKSDATVGGNLSGLRPTYTAEDLVRAEQSASYLKPGAIARCQTIFWEVFWSPNDNGNYRGIDKLIDIMAKRKLKPLFLLSPTPYPSSPWYANNAHSDWWVPARSSWPQILKRTDSLITHIQERCKATKMVPMYQLLNEPAGRLTNPPIGNKPGGSNRTEFGEWHPDLHEFMFGIVQVLKNRSVPRSSIVAPAISCVNEGTKRESTEWLSSVPPPQFDWLSECGYRAFNFRFSAGWATDPKTRLAEITKGFTWCANYLEWCNKQNPAKVDQRVLLTEVYVTPADCGTFIGDDLNPYRKIVLDLCRAKKWKPIVWGLLPDEADVPGNPWFFFGGWGDFLSTN